MWNVYENLKIALQTTSTKEMMERLLNLKVYSNTAIGYEGTLESIEWAIEEHGRADYLDYDGGDVTITKSAPNDETTPAEIEPFEDDYFDTPRWENGYTP